MQLGNKCRPADTWHVVACDDQAKVPGKLGLLNEAKRLCRVRNPPYVRESPLQNRQAHECLQRVIVHQ